MNYETFAERAAQYRNVVAALHPDYGLHRLRAVPVGHLELAEDATGYYATIAGCDFLPLGNRLALARKLGLQLIAGAERDTLYRLANHPVTV